MTYDAESINFRPVRAKQVARPLDVHWIHGSESAKHTTDPDIQVRCYDEHTVILRQNMAINYEALTRLLGNAGMELARTQAANSPHTS